MRMRMHSPDELKALVEEALERLDLWPELHGQATSVRYALEVGGKRVRPVIALAVGEALGAPVEQVMPAALAIELVHTFSLVHDDLPAMDDDEERRGHPSPWKKFGEGVGVLAGDALVAEAFRLAARYESSAVARELAEATLGMIGGQYLDTEGGGGIREWDGVLLGSGRDEMCSSGRGQVLAPWPNRLAGGRYEWEDDELQLPVNEVATGSAIHGLVRWGSWHAVEHEAARVVLEHVLHPQPGYPFALRLRVEYRLSASG